METCLLGSADRIIYPNGMKKCCKNQTYHLLSAGNGSEAGQLRTAAVLRDQTTTSGAVNDDSVSVKIPTVCLVVSAVTCSTFRWDCVSAARC